LIDDNNHHISRNSKIICHKVTRVIAFEQNFSKQVQDENNEDVNTLLLADLRTGRVPFVDQNTMSASTRIYMDEDEDLSCHAV